MKLSTMEFFKNTNQNSDQYVHMEGELLQKYQAALLSIAEDIISVCEEEHLMYQLSGGSALGAVREGGFIPWDDDMDINMLKSDFPLFSEAFKKKYGEKYCLHTWETPQWALAGVCVRLRGSVIRTREDIGNDEAGFYIDIFLLENVPDNAVLRKIHGFFSLGFGFLLSCRHFYKNRALMREIEKENLACRSAFELKINIGRLLSFASVRRWAIITNWCYGLCKNDHSKYVSIPAGRKHYFGEMYLREGMVNTVDMEFEGRRWAVPRDYDAYFKALYGPDYMTPPPPEKRERHIVLELQFPKTAEEQNDRKHEGA